MEWKVRIGEQDYVARSADELRQWVREGRVRSDSDVFHPVFAKWMKAGELEELHGITPTHSTTPSPTRLSPRATAILVAIGIAVIAALVLFSNLASRAAARLAAEEEVAQKAQRQKVRAANIVAARTNLSSIDPERQPEEYVRHCETMESLDRASMSADLLARCAAAHFIVAKRSLANGDLASARRVYGIARVTEGGSGSGYERFDAELTRGEARVRERAEAEQKARAAREGREREKAEVAARRAYAEILRDRFLDKNLDIKVSVAGPKAERITLRFALFSDVWAHRIQKDGLLEELRNMGFKRVSLTDGYDYGVYWDFTK